MPDELNAVIIESILKRKGGTKIELGGTEYHFTPDNKGRHVDTVTNEDHIARLLGIPEGYRLVLGASTAAAIPPASIGLTPPAPALTPAPATPVKQPEPMSAAVQPVVAPVVDTSMLPPVSTAIVEPVENPDADVSHAKAPEPPETPAPAAASKTLENMTSEELFAAHELEVGRKAHPASGDDTLRAKIQAARDEGTAGAA